MFRRFFFLTALIAVCASCSKGGNGTPPSGDLPEETDPAQFVHFYFTESYVGLQAGESCPLPVRCAGKAYDLAGNPAELLYESSDPAVVRVSGDGLLSALAPGCATVSATSMYNEAQHLSVRVFPGDYIPYRNPTGDALPVLGWYSLMPPNITRENYRTMAEAGFNLSFSHVWTRAENMAALEAANGTGVRLMLMDLDKGRANLPEVAETYRHHPAFAGYWLYDEPSISLFADINAWNAALRQADREHFAYVNLLPDYSSAGLWGCSSFHTYFSRAVEQLQVNFLSFDYYPVMNGTVRKSFYSCYEKVKALCDAKALPFWAFGMSCQHRNYDRPTASILRFEVYTALAYGAQGIQYFTYQVPVDTVEPFGIAPVDAQGSVTEVYEAVREVNRELAAVGPLFIGASSVRRMFCGGTLPDGIPAGQRYDPALLPAPFTGIDADGAGILVSHLCNGEREYLMLVNRSFDKPQTLTLSYTGTPVRMLPDGNTAPAAPELQLEAGNMILFKIR